MVVPLYQFSNRAPRTRNISDSLVKEIENTFDHMEDLVTQLQGLTQDPFIHKLPSLKNAVTGVKKEVEVFNLKFKNLIQEMLPQARTIKGKKNDELRRILQWRDGSPCNGNLLSAWIDNKEQDLNILHTLIMDIEVSNATHILLQGNLSFVVALVIKRYTTPDTYSKTIAEFNSTAVVKTSCSLKSPICGRVKVAPQYNIKLLPLKERADKILTVHHMFANFFEDNKDSESTKCIVEEETLAEGEESHWDIWLRVYDRQNPDDVKMFYPPPGIEDIKVSCVFLYCSAC